LRTVSVPLRNATTPDDLSIEASGIGFFSGAALLYLSSRIEFQDGGAVFRRGPPPVLGLDVYDSRHRQVNICGFVARVSKKCLIPVVLSPLPGNITLCRLCTREIGSSRDGPVRPIVSGQEWIVFRVALATSGAASVWGEIQQSIRPAHVKGEVRLCRNQIGWRRHIQSTKVRRDNSSSGFETIVCSRIAARNSSVEKVRESDNIHFHLRR